MRIRIRSDPVFLHGSGSAFQISLDTDSDPVFKFLDPDLDPVSAKILENCRKVSKSDLSEENLKFMTKGRQKMKKQQFLIKTHHKIDGKFSRQRCLDPDPDRDPVCPERLDPDPDPEKFENRIRIRIYAKTPDPTRSESGSATLTTDKI